MLTSDTQENVQQMAGHGAIKPLCELLVQQEDWIVTVALETLENILRLRRSAWGSEEDPCMLHDNYLIKHCCCL